MMPGGIFYKVLLAMATKELSRCQGELASTQGSLRVAQEALSREVEAHAEAEAG